MRRVSINESGLSSIIREVLSEAVDPTVKIQSEIDAANSAYHQALGHQGGDEWPLMDKDGNSYGLSGDIKLDGHGYVTIPYTDAYKSYTPVKIRVLQRVGGKIKIIPGDYWDEGWKDVRKHLKQIIRDAQIGNGVHSEYDPAWEEGGSENKASLKDMNRRVGRRANAGMEYLESVIRESVKRSLNEWTAADGLAGQRRKNMEEQCMLEIFCYGDGSIELADGSQTADDGRDCVPVALYPVFDEYLDGIEDIEFEVEWNYRTEGMPKQFLDDRIQEWISQNKESLIRTMESYM